LAFPVVDGTVVKGRRAQLTNDASRPGSNPSILNKTLLANPAVINAHACSQDRVTMVNALTDSPSLSRLYFSGS